VNEREFEAKVLGQIDAIRRIGRKRLGRLSDLDDFTHEVVVRLYAARDQRRNEELFPRWASVTARNLAAQWNTKRINPADSALVAVPGPPLPDDSTLQAERWRALVVALTSLEPLDRELLVSYYVDDLGYSELQTRHGLSYSAIGVRLHRVKRKLRRRLGTLLGGAVALFYSDYSAPWAKLAGSVMVSA
jgi:RNA polymerase sigma factor (sigma-70 family)